VKQGGQPGRGLVIYGRIAKLVFSGLEAGGEGSVQGGPGIFTSGGSAHPQATQFYRHVPGTCTALFA